MCGGTVAFFRDDPCSEPYLSVCVSMTARSRDPLGDAGFDPAFRFDQRVGAEPQQGLGRRRVVGEVVTVQVEVELASDEIHDGRRHELARSQQAARVAEHVLIRVQGVGTTQTSRLGQSVCSEVTRTRTQHPVVLASDCWCS